MVALTELLGVILMTKTLTLLFNKINIYNLKFIFSIVITVVLTTGCATRCYISPFPDFAYSDSNNNSIKVISRGMFAKEIDTTFIKTNINGSLLTKQLTSDTLKFDYTISEIERINPNVYLLYVESKPRTTNPQIILQYNGCKNYKMTTKKVAKKLQVVEVKQLGNCMWTDNMKTKRLLSH